MVKFALGKRETTPCLTTDNGTVYNGGELTSVRH